MTSDSQSHAMTLERAAKETGLGEEFITQSFIKHCFQKLDYLSQIQKR